MPKRSSRTIIAISLLLAISGCRHGFDQVTPTPSRSVRNIVGMELRVAEENTQPTLRIVLPSHPASDRAFQRTQRWATFSVTHVACGQRRAADSIV
jgi:hypothetical protein